MLEMFRGLPVHVLVVHAVVILVPLAAAGTFAIALRPGWRKSFGPLVAMAATGALISTFVARLSGQWLRDRLNYGADFEHGQAGEQLIWWVLPFWLLTLGLVLLDRREAATGEPVRELARSGAVGGGGGGARGRMSELSSRLPGATKVRQSRMLLVVAVLACVTGLAAAAQTANVGEGGARSVWVPKLAEG